MATELAAIVFAVALAAVHVFAGWLHFLRSIPRSWWLSLGSGVSVAYVFVHLLPEITERQARVLETTDPYLSLPLATREHLLFLAVLAGFSVYYGVEQVAQRSKHDPSDDSDVRGASTRTSPRVFWVHMAAFAGYNVLIGYLLVNRDTPGLGDLSLYASAMALHFVVNDHGLREHHREAYHDMGRWILAGAILLGLVVGFAVGVPELLLSLLFAFLAGGIVLNVIKEELPEKRRSRFSAFAAGVVGYTVVLLLL